MKRDQTRGGDENDESDAHFGEDFGKILCASECREWGKDKMGGNKGKEGKQRRKMRPRSHLRTPIMMGLWPTCEFPREWMPHPAPAFVGRK